MTDPAPLAEDFPPIEVTDEEIEYHPAMAPLQEEEEAPQADGVVVTSPRDPTHRRLRAIAGANVPYIFLTMGDDGRVGMDFWGVEPHDLSDVFALLSDATAGVTE